MDGPDGRATASRPGTLVSRAREVDAAVRDALHAFEGPRVAWTSPDGDHLVGAGVAATVVARGADRFADVRTAADRLFATVDATGPPAVRPRLFGGFAFHDDHQPVGPWRGFPAAWFLLPRYVVARDDDRTVLAATDHGEAVDPDAVAADLDRAARTLESTETADPDPPGVLDTRHEPDREGWAGQVRAAADRIAAGRLRKVVLAQSLTADLAGPFALGPALAGLDDAYAECFRFAVDPGDAGVLFGATPERLITVADHHVETTALAGSVERGDTPGADDRLADGLRDSPKVAEEHEVVASAIRSVLEDRADVTVGERSVRRLANVQHLETPVAAELAAPTHVLDLVAALHPTPAVGGHPPGAATEFIRRTERFDRGWYAGPVGWFDADGDGEFAVAIRSAVADGRTVTTYAGNGIVAESDPETEYSELQLKYRPILDRLE